MQDILLGQNAYLAGGTSVALHFGHRQSEDLDFFCAANFNHANIRKELSKLGHFTATDERSDTLIGAWDKVKLSLMKYPYPLMEKPSVLDGVKIASVTDLALMKLDAISSRGTKRDFIDLYWISKNSGRTLLDYVRMMKRKYGEDYAIEHLVKSLSFFADAERQPIPKMLKKLTWDEVKSYFIFQSSELAKKFIF